MAKGDGKIHKPRMFIKPHGKEDGVGKFQKVATREKKIDIKNGDGVVAVTSLGGHGWTGWIYKRR